MATLRPGSRVNTPLGPGSVAYVRNGPPDYSAPIAVSVRLDKRAQDARYSGTVFAAVDVTAREEE
jgi:hypothetical protein